MIYFVFKHCIEKLFVCLTFCVHMYKQMKNAFCIRRYFTPDASNVCSKDIIERNIRQTLLILQCCAAVYNVILCQVLETNRAEQSQSHVHRMYFMGPNTFSEPWHLSHIPPEEIKEIV